MRGSDCLAIIIIRTLVVYFAPRGLDAVHGAPAQRAELPELAIAVLIADLAAHPLQDIGIPLMNGLLPIVVPPAAKLSSQARRCGTRAADAALRAALLFIRRGKIDQKEMKRCRLNLEELLRRAARPEHYRHLSGGVRRARDRRDDVSDPLSRVPPGDSAGPGAQPRDGLSCYHHQRRQA